MSALGVDKHCDKIEWETPAEILEPVRGIFGGLTGGRRRIPCDPCTSPGNHTNADVFYTATTNGLLSPWSMEGNFVNPPFGIALQTWMPFVGEQAAKGYPIVALYPCGSRFCTGYYQRGVLTAAVTSWTVVDHRVRFELDGRPVKSQNPWDSILYTYNIDASLAAEWLKGLGPVYRTELLAKPAPRRARRSKALGAPDAP